MGPATVGQLDLTQIISLGLNVSTILVGIKVLRYIARMEIKMQLVWADYARRHNIRIDDDKEDKE